MSVEEVKIPTESQVRPIKYFQTEYTLFIWANGTNTLYQSSLTMVTVPKTRLFLKLNIWVSPSWWVTLNEQRKLETPTINVTWTWSLMRERGEWATNTIQSLEGEGRESVWIENRASIKSLTLGALVTSGHCMTTVDIWDSALIWMSVWRLWSIKRLNGPCMSCSPSASLWFCFDYFDIFCCTMVVWPLHLLIHQQHPVGFRYSILIISFNCCNFSADCHYCLWFPASPLIHSGLVDLQQTVFKCLTVFRLKGSTFCFFLFTFITTWNTSVWTQPDPLSEMCWILWEMDLTG